MRIRARIGLEVDDDPLSALAEREIDHPFEQRAVFEPVDHGLFAAAFRRGGSAPQQWVRQRCRRGACCRVDLFRRGADQARLGSRHAGDRSGAGAQIDCGEHCVHEAAESAPARPREVADLDRRELHRLAGARRDRTRRRRVHPQRGASCFLDRGDLELLPPLVRLRRRPGRALVYEQQIALAQPVLDFALEIERSRVPPHDLVRAGLRPVKPRWDGERAEHTLRAIEHRFLSEGRTAGRHARRSSRERRRIDRGVERLEPGIRFLIGDGRDDEQIARASGSDVGDAHSLLAVALQEPRSVVQQLGWRAGRERHGPDLALGIYEPRGLPRRRRRAGVAEDDHRELQPLRLVDAHDADAFGPFLDHRRFRRLAPLGVRGEPVDEGAEAARAGGFESPRQLQHAQDVSQRLLSGWPHGDAGMRARRVEQARERLRDRPAVAAQMQLAEQGQGVEDLRFRRAHRLGPLAQRMQPAVALAEEHERVVAQGEERPLERGEYRQLVVGPLDGGGGDAHRQHLLARVVRASADEHVRDPPRLERADVCAGEVALVIAHALEEKADVTPFDRDRIPPVALTHPPAAPGDQPVDERRYRVGIRLLDAEVRHFLALAIDLRGGQRDHGRLSFEVPAKRIERDVAGLRASLHLPRKSRVHGLLDGRNGAEAGGEVQELGATGEQELLHVLVERDVRAAEPVDRLLRIAHDEQLSRRGARIPPARLRRVRGSDQQEDLRLQRVGVLELIHQDVREAPRELRAHRNVVADQVPGPHEQIEEVEAPGAALEVLVSVAERSQLFAEAGGEIGVAAIEECFQLRLQRIAAREDRRLVQVLREPLSAAPPVPQTPAAELMKLRLEPVRVAGADGLTPPQLRHPARDAHDRLRRPIVRTVGFLRQLADLRKPRDHLLEPSVPVERAPPPGAGKVAMLGKIPSRLPEQLARRRLARAHLAPQQPAHAFRRIGDGPLEPGVERLIEQAVLLFAGGDLEDGIDARLDRPLPQQVGAEGVDGADGRRLQPFQRSGQAIALLEGGAAARGLQLGAQAQLHLTGGQVGERHRKDPVERGPAASHQGDDARHQLGRLSGSSRGLHDQRRAEIAPDAIAGGLVRERPHGIPRSCASGASASAGLRRVRAHSDGPHTVR